MISLLGGDGCQVSIPGVLLLAASPLVGNILAGLLPPAYSLHVISLSEVKGDMLVVLGELLSTGTSTVDTDRRLELGQVIISLGIEPLLGCCQLEN